jgi:Putative NADH-flavin reductase
LDRGHSVTAFVRSAERLKPFGNQIVTQQGDLLNPAELEYAFGGHDAVISAFGPRVPVAKTDADLLQRFATAVTKAMSGSGVRRVIVESVAFLFKDSIFPPAYLLGRFFFPGTVADAGAMEHIFAQSRLDWTIVRPPELVNKPYSGKYRLLEGRLPRFGFKISRADVAEFMIQAAENHSSTGKIFGIAD